MSVEAKAREIEKRRSSKGLRTVTTGRCFEKNVLESLFASLIALMYTSESVISCVFRSLLRKRHHVSSYHSLCVLQLLSSLIHFPFSLVYRFVCVSATSSLILLSVFCVSLSFSETKSLAPSPSCSCSHESSSSASFLCLLQERKRENCSKTSNRETAQLFSSPTHTSLDRDFLVVLISVYFFLSVTLGVFSL